MAMQQSPPNSPKLTFLTLPRELRQQILHLTVTPSLSWDPVFWIDAEVSQERFIISWTKTLRSVSREVEEDVEWVEERWLGGLERDREERFRTWWGNLEKVKGGEEMVVQR